MASGAGINELKAEMPRVSLKEPEFWKDFPTLGILKTLVQRTHAQLALVEHKISLFKIGEGQGFIQGPQYTLIRKEGRLGVRAGML